MGSPGGRQDESPGRRWSETSNRQDSTTTTSGLKSATSWGHAARAFLQSEGKVRTVLRPLMRPSWVRLHPTHETFSRSRVPLAAFHREKPFTRVRARESPT